MKDKPVKLTMEQVENASHIQLCRWIRFLPVGSLRIGDPVTERFLERFRAFGGFTPEISKMIGWKE